MLGPVAMREAQLWIRTDAPADARITYAPAEGGAPRQTTPTIRTSPAKAHAATFTLTGVEPGTTYRYTVHLDGEATDAGGGFTTPAFFHERQPPPDIRIAAGGAHYVAEKDFEPPYRELGGGYGIFETIRKQNPDLMLWVGDTAHLRQSDWTSRSGYLKRFARARGKAELQGLLQAVPHYGIWGARDYAYHDAGRLYSHRAHAEQAFRAFWPRPVAIPGLEGIATRFRLSDVDFFLLDTRTHRNQYPVAGETPRILGERQIEWLRRALDRSTATFKIIVAGAPVLNPADSPENLSYAEREHTELLQMLRDASISGLFFISGGKPYGELTRLVHANSYNLFDLTLGPMTARPRENNDELNFFRMPGTSTFRRHFALIDVKGPEDDRALTMRVLSVEGNELWSRTVRAAQLRPAGAEDAGQ